MQYKIYLFMPFINKININGDIGLPCISSELAPIHEFLLNRRKLYTVNGIPSKLEVTANKPFLYKSDSSRPYKSLEG